MLSIGDSKASKLYLGDVECKKAYLGDTLVFDPKPPKYIAGIDWWATTLPSTLLWNDITYGDGKFLAVASYQTGTGANIKVGTNKAAISSDGNTWEIITLPAVENWRCVTYGNGMFVACDSTNVSNEKSVIAYSNDGITWSSKEFTYFNFSDITFGGGMFVAVSDGYVSGSSFISKSKKTIYSTDGINWTSATSLPASLYWASIAYGNGNFVAIASSTNIAAYSKDGITWAQTTMPISGKWYSVTYGNGKFVSVAYGSDVAAYSEDGITWQQTTMPATRNWRAVSFGDGKFVALAYGTSIGAYSYDGITWAEVTLPSSGNWRNTAYGNGRFSSVGYNSKKAIYSFTGNEAQA